MKKEKKIKAEIWQLDVCNSVMDVIHRNTQRIIELYIPSQNISCNIANDTLHCFIPSPTRYGLKPVTKKLKSITVSESLVSNLLEYINSQLDITNILKEVLK